ncbi:hypothetical protein RHMOL_Rhmol13G0157600 [Rhododendron molle]|uniref:Uncharacterized protein n=1 Tax=Rhododendron molle TaxID=49168 RepID=A0ACC0L8S1_RHOML|nr:hypothetical protein RHMOL_Rhmol13G0157600 [Rhododendron molle]
MVKNHQSICYKEELERDWFVEDEEDDGSGYVEDDDEQDVDGDKDEEGVQEDEGGDVEDEGDEEDDMNCVHRLFTHGFHLFEGKMDPLWKII